MKWFYNLKIGMKLALGFAAVAIIAGAIGIYGIYNLNTINNNSTIMYENITIPMEELAQMSISFQKERVMLRDMLLYSNQEEKQLRADLIEENNLIIESLANDYEKSIMDDNGRELFNEFRTALKNHIPQMDEVVELALANKNELAIQAIIEADFLTSEQALQNIIDELFTVKVDGGMTQDASADQTALLASTSMIILVVVGLFLAIIFGIVITKSITRPIKILVSATNKLALGEVEINTDINTKDEIGHLAKSIQDVINNTQKQALVADSIANGDLTVEVDVRSDKDLLGKALYNMVEQNNIGFRNIASSAEQVAVGSKQVSDSSIALSQGSTEQASSVEQLTASVEEISSQTKLNADNANKANELAEDAKLNASQGNAQMKEMLKAMDEINISSSNINKIIKVIDDIAFQTNILALNAAVEAARAGQYGKGFAVVAEEVRTLAGRSASAAKESTEMIENSISKVDDGTKIAKNTAVSLEQIVGGIDKVADLVSDIATASNEQAIGINQINQGIMQVSEVVQNNSATSEESAAASEELSSQAELLKNMVSRYKLKKEINTRQTIDGVNPEVLAMLENMTEKKRNESNSFVNGVKESDKPQILLSDREFGKY